MAWAPPKTRKQSIGFLDVPKRYNNMITRPALLFLLSDGIRGHLFQSGGVAGWISRFTGAGVVVMNVPRLSRWKKIRLLKWRAAFLPSMTMEEISSWLEETGASPLYAEVEKELRARSLEWETTLFLSAGSGAAPFTLALARKTGGKACTLMTPSVIGTAPFDFAVVPEHDHPKGFEESESKKNVLVTLGAPNSIFPGELEEKGWELAEIYPPGENGEAERWGILVGGDDANYRISPRWVRRALSPIFEEGTKRRADLYITTSRRTSPKAERELLSIAKDIQGVRMVFLASRDPFNPVPGMLGLCSRIFVTEDSVSMVSEAVTAGKDVFLLRTERRGSRTVLQNFTAALVKKRLLPIRFLWGVPRFDAFFAALEKQGFLKEMKYDSLTSCMQEKALPHADGPALNEAKRAAEWILERWNRN